MATIRVLYIEGGSGTGGSSTSLYRFLKVLQRNGVTPIVAARQNGPNIDRIRELGIRIFIIPRLWGGRLTKGALGKCFVIPRLLSEMFFLGSICLKEKTQIIHLNTGVASGLSGVFTARCLGIPCVSHARGNEARFMGRVAWTAARWVDEYLCVSSAAREAHGLDRLKAKEAIRTIYDGLDTKEFQIDPSIRIVQRQKLGLSEKECAVGMVARFVEGKGHEQFLWAAREVVNSCQNAVFFLVGVNGSGNGAAYEERIRRLAKELSLGDRVRFLGWQSDVKPVVAAMDLIVLPSLGEGLGLALAEAMALGKAVVATKVGGIPELIRDGQEGILVPPSNAPALAKAIKELAFDNDRRRQMSEAGRNRISKYFSIERVAGDILDTYEQLLTRRRSTEGRAKRLRRVVSKGVSDVTWSGLRTFGEGTGQKNRFSILMYHRVVREEDPFFPGISEGGFERQLLFLKKYFTVLRLGEAVDLLSQGKTLPSRTVCLTFDDGLRNTFEAAFPILSRLKLPATVFLTTGAMDRKTPIWPDLVALLVSRHAGSTLIISGNGIERRFFTGSLREKTITTYTLKRWSKEMPDEERTEMVAQLEKATSLSSIQEDGIMMTWEQARLMSKAGIEFGAHTVSHPILSRVSAEVLKSEIADSRRRIEEMTGQRVSLFAYPNGEAGDFDERAIDHLKAEGFAAACTTIYGVNKNLQHPFLLKRLPGFEQPLSSLGCRLVGLK